jgi:hypothetical protein
MHGKAKASRHSKAWRRMREIVISLSTLRAISEIPHCEDKWSGGIKATIKGQGAS